MGVSRSPLTSGGEPAAVVDWLTGRPTSECHRHAFELAASATIVEGIGLCGRGAHTGNTRLEARALARLICLNRMRVRTVEVVVILGMSNRSKTSPTSLL